jgi:hypothetical protein
MKPLSIILLGDVIEAQKWVSFARGKAPVAHKYSTLTGASSFRKQYRPKDGVEVTVQSLQGATTIYINAELPLGIYIQDDRDHYQLSSPTRLYYTTDIWKIKKLPSNITSPVVAEKVLTVLKEPGKWNDEYSNFESWINFYPKEKIELLYPSYFYGASTYTPGGMYNKWDEVSTVIDFRYYLEDETLLSTSTANNYTFKYQPIRDKGYYRYFDPDDHRYYIFYSELDRFDNVLNAPRGIYSHTIGEGGYKQWWSGIPNFHVVKIHPDGKMYYTISKYDGTDVEYRIQSIGLNESPFVSQDYVSISSAHPTSLGVSDDTYKDPVEIICDVMGGDITGMHGYLTTQIESTTVWDDSGQINSVLNPNLNIYLGTSLDSAVKVAEWNGSLFHGLSGNHMTEGYNFTAVSQDLIYLQANTREWKVGPDASYSTVLVLKKESGVWNIYPIGISSTVEPLDSEWAIITSTSYSQLYNFKTEQYHNIVDTAGDPVTLTVETVGILEITPKYGVAKRVK